LIIACFSYTLKETFKLKFLEVPLKHILGEEPGLYGKELTALYPRRGAEKEAAETSSLVVSLQDLHEKYERRRREIRGFLEETGACMKRAVVFLKKANRLTRRLTVRQRQETGIFYHPSFFDSCLNKRKELLPLVSNKILNPDEALRELTGLGSFRESELGQLKLLRLMDALKKNLLALDLLEMRRRELFFSIDKALKAFKHEYAIVRRRLYPYGVFSVLYKNFRRLRGFSYFSSRDLKELMVLGELTGHVLKIANSPIL
jgi:hypothetical protein